jgi:agmatinase
MDETRTPSSFLAVETCNAFACPPGADVVIFGADHGVPHVPGTPSHAAGAPDALRAMMAQYAEDLTRWDFDQDEALLNADVMRVLDAGNLPTDPARPDNNRDLVRSATRAIIENGAVPFLFGGDDSVPIPFFEAFEALAPVTIVQIDAHLDWRHERNGIRHTFSSTMRRASEMPWIEKIVQVGMRGIGSSRRSDLEDARNWGATIVPAAAVARRGVHHVVDYIPDGGRCIVTIDCDGLDPCVMPAVIAPQPGGLAYLDVLELMFGVAAKARIVGFDLVELVPTLDPRGLGTLAAARLVCSAIGCVARQRSTDKKH